jgi:hypothetical protein
MGLLDSIPTDATPPQAAAAPAPPSGNNGQTAFNFLTSQGLAPHQAAGIVGSLQGESGQGLNPNAVNPGDGRDGSDSIGIGQWNGDRADALRAYAASKGTPWNDLNTQLGFLHSELQGPEKAAYQGLLTAKTPEDAGTAMLAYERPKDWNKPGAHPERAQYAARAMQAYGGTQQQATAAAPPLQLAPSAAPIFAQQPAAPQQQAAATGPAPVAPEANAAAPIFAARRAPVDISKLRAAFAAPQFYRT